MKVILQKNVANLGDAGEIRDVASGYARNYLFPRKLAIVAHAGSTKALLHQKRVIARKLDKREREMADIGKIIDGIASLELKVRVGARSKLFGSVTAMSIAAALKERGLEIDKRKVELGEKIKALGSYKVKVRLSDKLHKTIKVEVLPENEVEEEEFESSEPSATGADVTEAEATGADATKADTAKAEATEADTVAKGESASEGDQVTETKEEG